MSSPKYDFSSTPQIELERMTNELVEEVNAMVDELGRRELATVKVEKMTVENGEVEIRLTPGQKVLAHLAHSFADVLKENNAKNFVVMEVNHPDMGALQLTIQRLEGEKTVLSELARLKKYDEAEKSNG